jgi:hypothetical protein
MSGGKASASCLRTTACCKQPDEGKCQKLCVFLTCSVLRPLGYLRASTWRRSEATELGFFLTFSIHRLFLLADSVCLSKIILISHSTELNSILLANRRGGERLQNQQVAKRGRQFSSESKSVPRAISTGHTLQSTPPPQEDNLSRVRGQIVLSYVPELCS